MAQKTTFILDADEGKAVNAFLKVVDAQKKATDGMRKMNREGRQAGKSMDGIGRSIAGWAAGIVSLAGLKRGITAVIDEMEKVKQLQKESYDMALTNEERLLKIANLRGDVSMKGLETVRKEIADIALETSVTLDVANKALFYMESAMRTGPAATSAAIALAKFAGPAVVQPEEVAIVPAIFKKWGGVSGKEQMQLLSQLYFGARESQADVGLYLPQLLKVQAVAKELGFTFAETLALMSTAIEAAGVEQAGQVLRASMLYGTGKTEKARKYLGEQAAKRGLEYGEMGPVERYWFTADLYKEIREKGPRAEDVFKTAVAGKGFQYFMQMFSESARRKYEGVLPVIVEGLTSTIIDKMSEQFQELPIAVTARHITRKEIGAARIGERKEPMVQLEEMTTDILKKAHTLAVRGETIGLALTPEFLERSSAARMLIQENLRIGMENVPYGTEQWRKLADLSRRADLIKSFKWHPEFVERAYRATEGFTLPEKYGFGAVQPSVPYGVYGRGFEEYFGQTREDWTGGAGDYGQPKETANDQTKAIEENTKALNKLADKIPMPPIISSRTGPDE